MDAPKNSILVIGGGMSGITAALEAAEAGARVHLVESGLYLGGRVARLARYFPKMCPPTCGLEINYRRLRKNPLVSWYTGAMVTGISGGPGDYTATVAIAPRRVNGNCTACGDCVPVCPVERASDFDYGMARTKAIYLPLAAAMPMQYAIDPGACKGADCSECVKACKYDAIDLNEQPRTVTLKVGSVVVATGWNPYDATKLTNLGFGACGDVIANVQMERLLAEDGPTNGKVLRPSDGKAPRRVVFIQCAGSRDRNHLPYCSAVCCLASLKEALLVREQLPDAEITIFYIDLRSLGRNEDVLAKVKAEGKTRLIRGKGAKVVQDPATGVLTVEAEDTLTATRLHAEADLVVLATGMVPDTGVIPAGGVKDENGFVVSSGAVVGAGCAVRPAEMAGCMQDATGAALKAIVAAR